MEVGTQTEEHPVPLEVGKDCPADELRDVGSDPEEPELETERLYHFKIKYDPAWNYKEICKKFFMSDHKYLCVVEHVGRIGTHVHFQGYSKINENSMKLKIARLVKHHFERTLNPKCRPSSMTCRPPDVKGFQYMAKEAKNEYILAHNMFSKEDMKELVKNSELHCAKLKTEVADYVTNLDRQSIDRIIRNSKDGAGMIQEASRILMEHELKGKIELPPPNPRHTRGSIVRGLFANQHMKEHHRVRRADLYSL